MPIYISIGFQCNSSEFLKTTGLHSHSYPFDWLFSNPKGVFDILKLLLDTKMDIKELVTQHFFANLGTIIPISNTKFITDNSGIFYSGQESSAIYKACLMSSRYPYNSKYKFIFAHETSSYEDTVEKYIRRFQRLKDSILNNNEDIYFVYTSQSCNNYIVDGVQINSDVYVYLSEIYDLVSKYRSLKTKIILFDAILDENEMLLNNNVVLHKLINCPDRSGLQHQLKHLVDSSNNLFIYRL